MGCRLEGACGLKTQTSKKACSWRPPQNPLVATSSLAQSAVRAEALDSISPVTYCGRFSAHVVANFCHEVGCEVPDLVMA